MSLPPLLLLLEPESVVVSGVPVRVHLHVLLPLHPRLLVILGLLLATQTVPLFIVQGRFCGGECGEKM